MTRPRGGIIGAKPTWTTTATSGIWTLRQAEEMQADGKWPRGPVAPTSLAGTGADTEVALTWVAPATTHGTITNYAVEYTPSGGSPTVVLTSSTSASYTVTGLTNDTEYTFRVAAINHKQGEWSATATATPAAVSGWDISTASYVQNFSTSSQDSVPWGVAFSSDGTKMYIVGSSNASVYQYALSTAWDIATASYVQNFSVSSQEGIPRGIAFKGDGTKMYISGQLDDEVNEYSLSSAWDISTASYTQNFSVSSQDGLPLGLAFKSDGSKMYVLGQQGKDVNEYSLSTAWDISTASYVQNFSVSSQEIYPTGLAFASDGLNMYVTGVDGDDINQYALSSAWDISTASYVQNFSVSSQDTTPRGLAFKSDGTRMYVVGDSSDSVYEYSL